MYTLPTKNIEYLQKHNGNTRTWLFDLLEIAWHQPQTGVVVLMHIVHVALLFVISQIKDTH